MDLPKRKGHGSQLLPLYLIVRVETAFSGRYTRLLVLVQGSPGDKSKELAARLVQQKQKVDVARFIAEHAASIASGHVELPVHFVDANLEDGHASDEL